MFSRSVGLSTAVKQALTEKCSNFELKSKFSGLDLFKMVLDQLKKGTNIFNFLEGIVCISDCMYICFS